MLKSRGTTTRTFLHSHSPLTIDISTFFVRSSDSKIFFICRSAFGSHSVLTRLFSEEKTREGQWSKNWKWRFHGFEVQLKRSPSLTLLLSWELAFSLLLPLDPSLGTYCLSLEIFLFFILDGLDWWNVVEDYCMWSNLLLRWWEFCESVIGLWKVLCTDDIDNYSVESFEFDL